MNEQVELVGNAAPFENAAKLFGESMVPGASLMIDGKVVTGAAHALLGFGARALAGPAGVVLIAANSYSRSVTGKNLWEYVTPLLKRPAREPAAIEADTSGSELPAGRARNGKATAKA